MFVSVFVRSDAESLAQIFCATVGAGCQLWSKCLSKGKICLASDGDRGLFWLAGLGCADGPDEVEALGIARMAKGYRSILQLLDTELNRFQRVR